MKTLIVGASNKSDRYSHKAMLMLERYGHEVILLHPALKEIDGRPVVPDIDSVKGVIDTVTLYVNPSLSDGMETALKKLKPRRVIFNPGTENPRLARVLRSSGIQTEEACTLVLLQTSQF